MSGPQVGAGRDTTRPASTSRSELTHVGLCWSGPQSVLDGVAPVVEPALERGAPVVALGDATAEKLLAEALGPMFDRIEFISRGPTATTRLAIAHSASEAGLRAVARTLSAADDGAGVASEAAENRINLMLADHPVTVICARTPDAGPGVEDFRRRHPFVVDGGSVETNPGYGPPPRCCLLPAPSWGGDHVLRRTFRRVEDLGGLRREVAELAPGRELGRELGTEVVDAAVLAVHEAALAAVRAARTDTGTCQLDAWSVRDSMVFDVSAGPQTRPRWHDQMRLLELIASDVRIRFDVGTRLLRVIVGPALG